MAFNVLDYLRPHKQAKASLLGDLAQRLHSGQAIDPDEILEQLDASGATEEQLQAEIERLERVAELRKKIDAAAPATKRMGAIQAEIDKAQAGFEKAAGELRRVRDKHAPEVAELQATISDAESAKAALLQPGNMPAQTQATLRELMEQAQEAHQAMSIARQDLDHAKARMAECDVRHPEAIDLAKRNRSNADIQEDAQRWERAKVARTQQLADAEAAWSKAQAAVREAEAAEERYRAQVITGGGK